jgi:hypothetical protein
MMWQLRFFGRQKGAIGICTMHVVNVEAETVEQARWRAYETHEHISGGVDGVAAFSLEVGDAQEAQ